METTTLDLVAEVSVTIARPITVYLFGSHATGGATAESDLDVLVVVSDQTSDVRGLASTLRLAIATVVEMPCDVLVERESMFSERRRLPTLERTIAETGITLYAA